MLCPRRAPLSSRSLLHINLPSHLGSTGHSGSCLSPGCPCGSPHVGQLRERGSLWVTRPLSWQQLGTAGARKGSGCSTGSCWASRRCRGVWGVRSAGPPWGTGLVGCPVSADGEELGVLSLSPDPQASGAAGKRAGGGSVTLAWPVPRSSSLKQAEAPPQPLCCRPAGVAHALPPAPAPASQHLVVDLAPSPARCSPGPPPACCPAALCSALLCSVVSRAQLCCLRHRPRHAGLAPTRPLPAGPSCT